MRPAVEPCEEALALALDPAWRLRGARAEVPHLPYIPEGWNGRLVLGEAQSLSKGTKPPSYVEAVLGMAAAGNLAGLAKRLWHSAGGDTVVCVAPWHSGPIRIGLAARWPDEDVEAYGVSNAVPWATVDKHERNENPDTDVRLLARAFLARVIEIYGVREIVACGRVAQWVAAGLTPVVCFPSGSSRALASTVAKFTAGAVHPLELVGARPAHVRDRVHGRRIDDLLSAAYAAAAIAAPRLPGPATNARVSVDAEVFHGRPCIRGTRIPVSVVLDNLAAGLPPDEVVAAYPSLTLDDVRASLSYAAAIACDRDRQR